MLRRSRPMLLGRALLCAVACVAGCTPDFDDVWQVKDLRLLAIRAEPPEVLLPAAALTPTVEFPAVRVDALVVDPRDPQGELEWQVVACTPEAERCEYAALQKRVYPPPGGEQWARSRPQEVGFDFVLDQELALAALAADPFKGFGGLPIFLELHLRGREEVVGLKRLVYGVTDPAGKQPNENPQLVQVKVDDVPLADEPLSAAPAQEVVVLPVASAGSKESYLVKTFSGGSKELDEFISFSFFVTEGKLSHGRTGGKPSLFVTNKKVDDVTSAFTAPDAPQQGQLWVVVRDDRGGVDWRSFDFVVQ